MILIHPLALTVKECVQCKRNAVLQGGAHLGSSRLANEAIISDVEIYAQHTDLFAALHFLCSYCITA